MMLRKYNLILHFLILTYGLSLSNAIECRVCKKGDPACLFAPDAGTRECENENDVCYSWFYRTGGDVGAQRDCMSLASPMYSVIKAAISDKNTGCIKRIRGLDCFTFCSTDLCN